MSNSCVNQPQQVVVVVLWPEGGAVIHGKIAALDTFWMSLRTQAQEFLIRTLASFCWAAVYDGKCFANQMSVSGDVKICFIFSQEAIN